MKTKNLLKSVRTLTATLITFGSLAGVANGAIVTFTPTTDPAGSVFTTNSNDGWNSGRGIVFSVSSSVSVDSIGVFQDLTNEVLSYEVSQVSSLTGNLNSGLTVISSGNNLVTTIGLEFIDFNITPVTFSPGNNYHIEFSFSGNSNQNFYHNNANNSFDQGVFTSIEGTLNANTSNSAMPSIRINSVVIPEPSSALLLGLGALGLLLARRRNR